MLGMSGPETTWILTILIILGFLMIVSIVQEIGKTRRAVAEAKKAQYDAVVAKFGDRDGA
jgi:hypothetical protein